MSKQHSPGFLAVVANAKSRVKEIDIEQLQQLAEPFLLIDVREDREWQNGHLPNALHIGKSVIERDIETAVADKSTVLVLYSGGGFRSALAGDMLQLMGYSEVLSLAGGYTAWVNAGLPLVKGD